MTVEKLLALLGLLNTSILEKVCAYTKLAKPKFGNKKSDPHLKGLQAKIMFSESVPNGIWL